MVRVPPTMPISSSSATLLAAAAPVALITVVSALYLAVAAPAKAVIKPSTCNIARVTNRWLVVESMSHVLPPAVGWFSASPHKAWGERFFLLYSPFWISFFAVIVATGAYERFAHIEYMAVCLAIAVPCFAVPLVLQPKAEALLPFWKR